ncbi:MAG: (d)CMP kinase [Bacteroidales bacterium]|nr:(d)CMP kinase [Candidatus Colicola faecequi]
MRKIIVAIDGFSSCGKSTIAKALAKKAGYRYVDTGAMYRAVALYTIENKPADLSEEAYLEQHIADIEINFAVQPDGTQHTTLNGRDVEKLIRTLEVGNMASKVSAIGFVRRALVAQQQAMGKEGGVVMDGRDIGTVVFPQAELKLFLTASPEIRAERRFKELEAKGEHPVFEDVLADVNDRDYRDTHRAESPMHLTEDSVVVDNSHMTPDEQMQEIFRIFEERIAGKF